MNEAIISWLSGPVLRAKTEHNFHVDEAVLVGNKKLLGEVIHLDGEFIVVQVYEDTSGLRPGDKVIGDGLPLSIKLGPHILGHIFDGLLRPLTQSDSYFIHPGMQRSAPGIFKFMPRVTVNQYINGGAVIGMVTSAFSRAQQILLPPHMSGKVIHIASEDSYDDETPICTLQTNDKTEQQVSMSHIWPVRKPRPISERLPTWGPLLTGQRILDCLFPLACGGRASMPGGFGTGKTVLQMLLSMSVAVNAAMRWQAY